MKNIKIIQLGAKIGSESGMGRGNAGDTAVGAACSNVYQNEFSNCEITYMNCRQIYEQKHIDEINTHDILIVSGGGLFLKDTFPNTESDWQWGISPELLNNIELILQLAKIVIISMRIYYVPQKVAWMRSSGFGESEYF